MTAPTNIASEALGPTLTIGEIIVEIMSDSKGETLSDVQSFAGPYPSGAPAIFIDQAARLGAKTAIIGAVGDDEFGALCIARLKADGVDISAVQVLEDYPTGVAFVRYQESGTRKFIYNIGKSAAGQLSDAPRAETIITASGHLHVMGSALSMPDAWRWTKFAVDTIKLKGGSVSFDPNLRPELLGDATTRARFEYVLENTDIFLPSDEEALLLEGEGDANTRLAAWVAGTQREAVLKQGKAGATVFFDGERIHCPGFDVEEIDPTGAGDCFGAAYVTCRRMGYVPEISLKFANAAGALAVTKLGPMEGIGGFTALKALYEPASK